MKVQPDGTVEGTPTEIAEYLALKNEGERQWQKLRRALRKTAPVKRKRPARHRAPRWTKAEHEALREVVADKRNYSKKGLKGEALRKFARQHRRSTKGVALRIQGHKDLRDLRAGTMSGLWTRFNKFK